MSLYATITPADLKARLANGETIAMIDVREDDEVALGMIPGAVHIPLGQIPDRLQDIPNASELVLICRSGGRSARACDFLAANGRSGLVNMSGGMLEWAKL
jgi:rhodanese-related sulfurtransferase